MVAELVGMLTGSVQLTFGAGFAPQELSIC
jgi:hypothetical protein